MQESKDLKFEEINEGFSAKEAIDEAKRCLNCKNPLCVKGCPIEHDIPGFIHQLSMGNVGNALQIINEKSNLPAICGRVCPHEKQCEGHCILNKKEQRIRVGKLERFIADFDGEMGLIREKLPQKNRGKVAVIGSGPAGLTVAGDLARQGFNVVIYEGEQELGGVLMFGIPKYRLPKSVVKREIEKIAGLGVTFITHCMVGKDITVDDMFDRGFDAVFIGTGTAIPKSLSIPGSDLVGVVQSSYFLRMVNLYQNESIDRKDVPLRVHDEVFVIGAGNVAMDAARTAIRMGAKNVSVLYHKTEADMPALRTEYEEAVDEGVQFLWNTSTVELIGKRKRLSEITIHTPEGEKTIPADRVLLAIGSRPANRIVSTTEGIEVNDTGYVITKERPYGMTTKKGVFAGGDVVHTPQTVVLAMREAKQVAKGIAQFVDAKKLLEE
ncbi:NAD(P)-dependent oxidoreductase [Paludibacter jiangxiensis]|uniref:Glutamate synthase (NADPH/NADH) small chain n=1 Tax=Paludibacter jiangxiensis TaxID=681398 RepID=A0A161LF18_9BACT|nr:NAD(P)-dependent oxidoreductase [Paludibacter jiangxiensis]GAT63485.1 glutamate synthase (NADPH/NADH) small chain [Paludibacter jiangxiensis]